MNVSSCNLRQLQFQVISMPSLQESCWKQFSWRVHMHSSHAAHASRIPAFLSYILIFTQKLLSTLRVVAVCLTNIQMNSRAYKLLSLNVCQICVLHSVQLGSVISLLFSVEEMESKKESLLKRWTARKSSSAQSAHCHATLDKLHCLVTSFWMHIINKHWYIYNSAYCANCCGTWLH